MLCPFCREKDTSVVDSRPTEDGTAIRRRRLCTCNGGMRFTTFERVQHRELSVIKKNGRRVPFDREKLAKSFFTALKKRPTDQDTIERVVSKISRELEEIGQSEIQSSVIGKKVMEALKELDKIAYIRDCNKVSLKNIKYLKNLNYLILDCLKIDKHPSHFNLDEALNLINITKPKKAILTNLHTDLDYFELKKILPKNITPAYDGLSFTS